MRGKAFRVRKQRFHDGITPAYAGKSTGGGLDGTFYKDHPRLCGEKPPTYCVKICRTGSPPPMRGKVPHPFPAYLLQRDHPRLCGEKIILVNVPRGSAGSPPPMRGKDIRVTCNQSAVRDHPRLCGEKGMPKKLHICFMGSPPPMRGKD